MTVARSRRGSGRRLGVSLGVSIANRTLRSYIPVQDNPSDRRPDREQRGPITPVPGTPRASLIFCVTRNARAGLATRAAISGPRIRRLLELHAVDAGCGCEFPHGLGEARTSAGGHGRRPHRQSDPMRVPGIELLRVVRSGKQRGSELVSLGHDEGGHVSRCVRFHRSPAEEAFAAQVSSLSFRARNQQPLPFVQLESVERPVRRVHEPQVSDAFAGIDRTLLLEVEPARRG